MKPSCLKEATRQKRGKGIRRKVSGGTKLPPKWKDFLRESVNKQELFQFLTSKVAAHNWPEEKTLCVTSDKHLYSSYCIVFPIVTVCLIQMLSIGNSVITVGSDSAMPECNYKEAGTRIVVHILHAIQDGQAKTVLVRSVDTDVVVILIGKFHYLRAVQPDLELWVAFGMGRNFSFISVNSICDDLYRFSTLSLVAIPPQHYSVKAKCPPGRHGSCTLKSRQHWSS